MNRVEIRPAPHIRGVRTVEGIMKHVVFATLPLCAFFVYQYGISALFSILVITATCLLTERLLQITDTQSGSLRDFSAVITGLLLALSLPPGFPLWMGVVAGVVAILLGKGLFGGLGFNIFNPALVGRAFVQAAFPTAIASYTPSFLPGRFLEFIPSSLALPLMTPPAVAPWVKAMEIDALSSATPLVRWKFETLSANTIELFTGIGNHLAVGPAPWLILIGGIYLASRRFLDWRIPVAVLISAGLFASALYALDATRFPDPAFTLLSGGLLFGAVFMATDMATSPVTPSGMWLYGALIGVLTVLIRNFGGLPEGVMYAILIANAVTPLIESVTQPTPFGKGVAGQTRKGASYSLHPEYISREESSAVTPKKKLMKNKPKPDDRRKPQKPTEK